MARIIRKNRRHSEVAPMRHPCRRGALQIGVATAKPKWKTRATAAPNTGGEGRAAARVAFESRLAGTGEGPAISPQSASTDLRVGGLAALGQSLDDSNVAAGPDGFQPAAGNAGNGPNAPSTVALRVSAPPPPFGAQPDPQVDLSALMHSTEHRRPLLQVEELFMLFGNR